MFRPLLGLLLLLSSPALADFDRAALDRSVKAIAGEAGLGTLGVAVMDLTDGASYAHHGDRTFPMQSVYKLPIGIAVLRQVDQGALSLDQPITVTRQDISIPFSPMTRELTGESRVYPLRKLIEKAVGLSDNTATDKLIHLVGGPSAVTGVLRELGIAGIRVDRLERELYPELLGLGPFRDEWLNLDAVRQARDRLPEATRRKALGAYLADPRDTATPVATVDLLAKLKAGKLLSPSSTRLLLAILTGSPTGPNRLKAGLPKGSALAHKTGTSGDVLGIGAAVNDVGLATLPDGRVLAIAVYLSGSDRPGAARERLIAEVAKAAVAALR